MNLEPFTGPGSTPSRRKFWDKVTAAVIACQKVEGNNVTVAEHQGAGTLINVNRVRGLEGGVGACCYDDGTCDDLTEAACNDAGGNWQGSDTTCADDPNPCLGACCEGEGGTTCVEDSTPDSCAEDGGTFHGFGSTCDPNPCGAATGACCVYGTCFVYSESVCTLSNGYYFGDGTDCDPDPCADLGCCITPGDPFSFCNTILGEDCSGTFGGPATFCWPEGEESFELNSCCNNGQITCSGGELGFHFCCDPGFTCCGDIGCCEEGQTCDEIFGCM